jgi:hypothetical protein
LIDQKSIATALGAQQGFQSQDFTSNLSITTLPGPASSSKTVVNTGNATNAGVSLPDTTQTTNSKDVAALASKPPDLADAQQVSGFTPIYGENASDLLSDQTNLTYQIMNLQMILERSLSDRLLDGGARLQAVLGFNVTLDPPRTANDAVAVVEVTVDAQGASTSDLSLVSLMPQEKTYNSAALSTKSNSFGGSAVVKMIQVGYSQRRQGKTFYLYRDTDTVAYERIDSDSHKVVFGWMFRPVLGRRSISPGLRQLFAVLALPAKDGESAQILNANVVTYWKKYDAKTMTSFLPRDANRGNRARYIASMGLAYPQIFAGRYQNHETYAGIKVEPAKEYEKGLRPSVTSVTWRATGAKTALISVKGTNLFTGTQVLMGDKVYATVADGLTLKSNETFDLLTPLDALSTGPGAILGRYGAAVPLTVTSVPAGGMPGGIEVREARLGPTLGGFRSVEIYLRARTYTVAGQPTNKLSRAQLPRDLLAQPHKDLTASSVNEVQPIISFNGRTVALPYSMREESDEVVLVANVPASLISGTGGIVEIAWPFLPPDQWTAVYRFYDPASTFGITRFSDKTIFISMTSPEGFTIDPRTGKQGVAGYCWQLLAGEKATKIKTSVCGDGVSGPVEPSANGVSLTMADALPDKVMLIAPYSTVFPLDVPKLTPTPTAVSPAPIQLKQFDALWVDVNGKDFIGASAVEANQTQLKFRFPDPPKDAKAGDPVKTIQVEITRDLTTKPGNVDVTISDMSGKQLGTARLQIACISLCEAGGK